nr:hypothetical protein [Lactococcus garvieae]
MLTEEIRNCFLQVLEEGVKPATGCTEPVAVAYAAAVYRTYLEDSSIDWINIRVSANVMKNALAVIVPGTREAGVEVAAAAGALAGNAEAGLKVISELSPDIVPEIISLARSKQVKAEVASVADKLYVEFSITAGSETVTVKIAGGHTSIYWIEKNKEVIFKKEKVQSNEEESSVEFLKKAQFC